MLSVRRLLVVALLALFGASIAPASSLRASDAPDTAPTYTIFATRQGLVGHRTANGHRIQPRDRFVALPSYTALSSKGGSEFQVRVTYRDRSVILPVWDVGPWNTTDDYWSTDRRYNDLPVGVPMAQAAYQDGYNNGRDAWGRRVRHPNGIDIADGAFWDDLGMTGSDWVQVTFLWLGSDPGPPAQAQPQPQQATVAETIAIEPDAVAIDDSGDNYSAAAAVRWYDAGCGLNGRSTWTYGTSDSSQSENHARWSATVPASGFYEAFAYVPPCGQPATRAARYRLTKGDRTIERIVDQEAAAGTWVSLGTYYVNEGTAVIELDDVTTDAGRAVRFDAVKWAPRTDSAPPNAQMAEAQPQADGSFLVRWRGDDDVSGVAAYDVQLRKLPDGEWSDWQLNATIAEALFAPPEPGEYVFRVKARDWAGNHQPWPEDNALLVKVE
jgi:hypothetical protein